MIMHAHLISKILIVLSASLLLYSCGYKKKYEDAVVEAEKNKLYESLYEEQKQKNYNLQDSLEIYKKDLNSLIYQMSVNNMEPGIATADTILNQREKELNRRIERLQQKNQALLNTIARLDSIILVRGYDMDEEQETTNNYVYRSRKVHLLNTLRSIQAEYPDQTELLLQNNRIQFSIERDVLFAGTYNYKDDGIEIIRQITQALNPLFGHEVAIESDFSLEDPYSDEWKEAIQGQIMIAQLMRRFGANQDRIDGANKFTQGEIRVRNYNFVFTEIPVTSP
jgi:hypothetical protein